MSRAYGLAIAAAPDKCFTYGNTAQLVVFPCQRGLGFVSSAFAFLAEREAASSLLSRWDKLMAKKRGWQEIKDDDIVPLFGIGAFSSCVCYMRTLGMVNGIAAGKVHHDTPLLVCVT